MKKLINKLIRLSLKIGIPFLIFIIGLNLYITKTTKSIIFSNLNAIPKSYAGLVLGAKVYKNGKLSGVLQDRVDSALELYNSGKIKRFLLIGDHGTTNYDEVNQMKKYLIQKGVPTCDIFLDHAGFDTYNSIYRAKKVFLVDDVIIITQKFHIKRAVYIANSLGLNASGFTADKHTYGIAKKMVFREGLANVKAFLEIGIHRKPKYLGNTIDIKGDSNKSYD